MTAKNPRIIVVDASIAKSAGGKDALHPIPIRCRDFLDEIRKSGHTIFMTTAILEEWKKHASPFSNTWYTAMLRKGLVQLKSGDTTDFELRDRIYAIIEENARTAVEKDMRLIEAARLADERIASWDEKIRGHFRRAAIFIEELQIIVWVNPTIDNEECVIWLRQSAPDDDFRKLGYVQSDET